MATRILCTDDSNRSDDNFTDVNSPLTVNDGEDIGEALDGEIIVTVESTQVYRSGSVTVWGWQY